ncbi:anti-sigma factor [Spirosoma endbachense]|uniref:Tetratricopeptide repeat protein n=1 Tax=Spirosoma endbachense TaxID=2666025 RepID=A0A6P1VWJ7_9BACT|nr:anti-sigma factor [Spirosoma endbachense]QHV96147.1 hypothetical protein GJR95_14515 [Spirosoma endbachense]
MELSDELLEQIGAYLSGKLSAEEKDRFDDRLAIDSLLQQEVAIQRELKQGLSFLAQKDRFKQVHADLDKRGLLSEIPSVTSQPNRTDSPIPDTKSTPFSRNLDIPRRSFRYGWASWAMAASVVLVLGIGWVLYRNQTQKQDELAQNERIFNDFFSAEIRSAPPLSDDPDRVSASPDNGQAGADSVRLHALVERLQRTESQPVIDELTDLSASSPGHWSASAQWYLALAYLKNDQRTEAQVLLQKISQLNGHPYQQEARRLLNQLRSSIPHRP